MRYKLAKVCDHTPCPIIYIQWRAWAHMMRKTHRQCQCPACGLWAVWKKK